MQAVIELVNQNLRTTLIEIITLGRSLTKCADEGLAYLDRRGTSKGPTDAISGRLEHLGGSGPPLPQHHQLPRQVPGRDRRARSRRHPRI
jgi:hypothetical protein